MDRAAGGLAEPMGVAKPTPIVRLSVAADVDRTTGIDVAVSACPWLRLDVDVGALAGRWTRLTYRAGLLEPLARPLLRCFRAGAFSDQALPAPLFGRAIWLGLIPAGTEEIWISPTNRLGPFAFAIERIERPSRAELAWALFRRSPRRWLIRVFAPLVGLPKAADIQIRRVLSATPLSDYEAWRRARLRPLDLGGFDSPQPGRQSRVHIRFVTQVTPGTERHLPELLALLGNQPYPHWTLAVLDGPEAPHGPTAGRNERVLALAPIDHLRDLLAGLVDADLIAPLALGDLMPAYAPAAFARTAEAHPDTGGFFGDADTVDRNGRYRGPELRPDWSPILFESSRDVGPATAFRAGVLRHLAPDLAAGDAMRLPEALAGPIIDGRCPMLHIRRVLRTRSPRNPPSQLQSPDRRRRTAAARPADGRLRATLIIPTKDKLELLSKCVDSLRNRGGLRDAEVIVVDNGSTGPDTKRFLADLVLDERFRVLSDPGPFNFSRLCNRAAALAGSPVLVFLNNDTEIVDATWLDALICWAHRPDIGPVGAKLLYPTGRVQHAGVVVGLDGIAGHFERQSGRDAPGYFGRLNVPHEVSAVTAACLAVEKWKFDAVNGFDEANLPVDLNDIDLCLRLGAMGWKSVLAPCSVLIHHESASRGMTHNPHERYRHEQSIFRARWLNMIRDDPYFHPALSLDSLDPSLG